MRTVFSAVAVGLLLAQAAPAQEGASALTADQVQQLLAGEGMGLAKAAEVTGYPGPKHVLDLADALALERNQRAAITASFDRMTADVRRLGAGIVRAERDLYAAFETRQITAEEIDRLTARIGYLQASLRARHLRAHLETIPVLTPEQVAEYVKRRAHVH